ncbi:MAG: MATE family efflux transporter [Lachnospiraceae bacterium]|nr:MATE family efflux transporter [Ruminococcus sp.]MCM1275609.1 MATE family efflux transporter [Lachnospiraceae bacterium]MCM1276276.1 MATE family efflux transporter [Lachnospiraceae bacterium]
MNLKNEKMAAPVGRLMLSMGLPMIVSMVLQAVYNIVDSAFVSNMPTGGEDALNALTLAFPLQVLMVAVGIGTGVGANVLIARSLGQKDEELTGKTAGNAVLLGAVIYAVFLSFGLLGAGAYINSQTDNPVVSAVGTDYLRICCVFSFGMSMFAVFEKVLQAAGHSLCSTIAQILGAVTNIVLDPILIYGWLGLPEMGVKGAAYATVIGQVVSFAAALIFHLRFNKAVRIRLRHFKPSLGTVGMIYSVGLPAIISQALISVMTYGMNLILKDVSENMVTAYGLYYKIQQFLLFAAFGMRDAITPITAFSYGMRDGRRIKDCVRFGQLYTAVIMLVGLIALEVFAEPFSGIFDLSGETRELCISAMRIISISLVFAGVNIAFQGVFQAVGSGVGSLLISVFRQLLFVFPFALVFAQIAKADAQAGWLMWAVFPIAELLTAAAAVALWRKISVKKNLKFTE